VLVVLDTNVLVSGLAFPGGPPGRLVAAWRSGGLTLALSDFLLDELGRVLPALSARTAFTSSDARDFLDLLRAMALVIDLGPEVLAQAQASGLRDPNDVPVLATLIASGADYLVTGDKDLLAIAVHFPVLTPAEFCARHAP
jgi:uncharacterized protein